MKKFQTDKVFLIVCLIGSYVGIDQHNNLTKDIKLTEFLGNDLQCI